ncbi:hypothetical protein [Pseudomonas lutea]|uniref:hypothetical protein n=1 Tax=Pseudomonas lutea TaxID=243924 RepID=UPI001269E426|nr:hypothetical protein [Pseudomonas lutea]
MGVGQHWIYKQYVCIGEILRIGPPGASGADRKRDRINIYAKCAAVWRRTEAAQRFTGESTDELHTYAPCSVDIVIIRGQMCSRIPQLK